MWHTFLILFLLQFISIGLRESIAKVKLASLDADGMKHALASEPVGSVRIGIFKHGIGTISEKCAVDVFWDGAERDPCDFILLFLVHGREVAPTTEWNQRLLDILELNRWCGIA